MAWVTVHIDGANAYDVDFSTPPSHTYTHHAVLPLLFTII